eukprot:scaffold109561_cov34-Tisochrysis_lutea.AAC.2
MRSYPLWFRPWHCALCRLGVEWALCSVSRCRVSVVTDLCRNLSCLRSLVFGVGVIDRPGRCLVRAHEVSATAL